MQVVHAENQLKTGVVKKMLNKGNNVTSEARGDKEMGKKSRGRVGK